MLMELDAAILEARFDDDIHVLVFTGHGENYFCAGANIQMLREVDQGFRYNFFLCFSETMKRLEQTPKLVIAALNGHAVGGGFEIALACDIRIARADAGTVGLPEINLGLLPGGGGISRLTRMVGKGLTMQLVLEGEKMSFDRACSLGLINHVWPTASHEQFMDQVWNYAHGFRSPHKAPLAVARAKRAVQLAYDNSIEQGTSIERELLAQVLGSDDATEGLDAWLEKREPQFQGK
jgi:enoyl-CoA hydratase/carnithine racemase